MAKYDWALIKREFIRGYKDKNGDYISEPTLKQISDRHGCNYDYLRTKAGPSNEKWDQEKHIYITKKSQKITEKEIEKISDESVELDTKSLDAAKAGIRKIINRLEDVEISNHDIQKLSSSLLDFQKAYKNVFGEPTEHTQNTTNSTLKADHNVNIPNDPTIRARGRDFIQSIRTGQMEPSDPGNGDK